MKTVIGYVGGFIGGVLTTVTIIGVAVSGYRLGLSHVDDKENKDNEDNKEE